MLIIGMLEAFAIAFLVAFYNVYLWFCVQVWNIEPFVFTCLSLMASAVLLLLLAGPGRMMRSTLKAKATWSYSALAVMEHVADVFIVFYISATESALFSRLNIVIALLIAWKYFNRTPGKPDMFGGLIITGAICWLTALQPSETLLPLMVVILMEAFAQTGQYIIAERHPNAVEASEKGSMRDKARVVGFVTFVTSLVLFGLVLILSTIATWFDIPGLLHYEVPKLERFIHPETVWTALFYGILILPLIRYFKWSASYKVKAENMLLVMAFIPVLTILIELVASATVGMPDTGRSLFSADDSWALIVIGCLITFGAGFSAFMTIRNSLKGMTLKTFMKQAKKEHKFVAVEQSTHAEDDYERVAMTLSFCGGSWNKASELLGIPAKAMQVVYDGEGALAFDDTVSAHVSSKYLQHVASKDALTGAYNRSGFFGRAQQALGKVKKASALYIDLDKFKPINDEYGHEAGDKVLIHVVKELGKTLPEGSLVCRLGGDEFCVLLFDAGKQKAGQVMKEVQGAIEKPVTIVKGKRVSVGASIGLSSFPHDAESVEALIKAADEGMYNVKKKRGQ
ncbi:MAG: GGDEF domain-containing protein [Pseudomonadota bacterium]|nr:GGDEF domain-containing protein [Pseudomonadota bacterium]